MNSTEINLRIYKVPVWVWCDPLPTLDEKRPLQGTQSSYFLVEEDNKGKARLSLTKIPSFHKNYFNLPKEERKNLRPFKLNRKGKIEQILECDKRYKNYEGDYTCGKPIHSIKEHEDKNNEPFNMNGEFGMCCIENYDPFDSPDCPYNTEI